MAAATAMAVAAGSAWGQAPGSGTSVTERREQLARDVEGLSDGDPLTRVATMEAILKRGDASAAYVAIRTAFASDDPALRNIALRAWFANAHRLNLSVALPGDLQRQVDGALLDPKQAADLFTRIPWLKLWSVRAFQVALGFTAVDVATGEGKVWSMPTFSQNNAVDFTIAGNQFFAAVPVDFIGVSIYVCNISLAPSKSLTLEGTVACNFNNTSSPPLRVTSPMF